MKFSWSHEMHRFSHQLIPVTVASVVTVFHVTGSRLMQKPSALSFTFLSYIKSIILHEAALRERAAANYNGTSVCMNSDPCVCVCIYRRFDEKRRSTIAATMGSLCKGKTAELCCSYK